MVVKYAGTAQWDRGPLLCPESSSEGLVVEQTPIADYVAFFKDYEWQRRFDVFECGLSTYLQRYREFGEEWLALPYGLSRTYRSQAAVVRAGGGAGWEAGPGRPKIGLREVGMTAALWVQLYMSEFCDQKPEEVEWVPSQVGEPVELMFDRLVDGSLDIVIEPKGPPMPYLSLVDPLFPDSRRLELWVLKQFGGVPVMHVPLVRRSLLSETPGLAQALFDRWEGQRRRAQARLLSQDSNAVNYPIDIFEYRHRVEVAGNDPYLNGFDAIMPLVRAASRQLRELGVDVPPTEVLDSMFLPLEYRKTGRVAL